MGPKSWVTIERIIICHSGRKMKTRPWICTTRKRKYFEYGPDKPKRHRGVLLLLPGLFKRKEEKREEVDLPRYQVGNSRYIPRRRHALTIKPHDATVWKFAPAPSCVSSIWVRSQWEYGLSKYLLPDENSIEEKEHFTLWNTVLKNVSRTVPAGIIFPEY